MKSTPCGVCFFVFETSGRGLRLMFFAYQQSCFVLHGFAGAAQAAAGQHAGAAAAVAGYG
ncbi:hypothetical protein [Aquitalea sp. ASV11]|uniref:hypothetical protein n=1 Tax=Aquitalea sp. ASV11 TaxID=2795103 RepID=UPI0018EB60F7|nr:hypothetical protein [Aquitalea sp. ASV11]